MSFLIDYSAADRVWAEHASRDRRLSGMTHRYCSTSLFITGLLEDVLQSHLHNAGSALRWVILLKLLLPWVTLGLLHCGDD